ncbi:hypothetical protein CONLIGDRAFT_567468 [Coniochaeta ligniaria NRRL 30616]|uniref:AA1-like domain-containing protein n=1 Tax=Coniochaeta ligniaria NRRL 30616 TaxID=1408157 RepID=A0A1J7J2N8_9PEZI|nr:hypothetical protein CONLIGDRAFT_567468 [Coniochaeta ligniaria NRRL 30616]
MLTSTSTSTALTLLLLSLPFSSPSPFFPKRDNRTSPATSCGCTTTSFSPWSWSLSDIYFHSSVIFSTPSHQIDGGWVSFSLAHPALAGVVFDCEASSTQLQDWFYGDQDYVCTGRADGEGGQAVRRAKATFRFDRAGGRVDVDQSWVCEDQDPRYPIYFKASGSGNVSLSCNETKWQNANWTSGQIYSTDTFECAKANLTIKPSEISATT